MDKMSDNRVLKAFFEATGFNVDLVEVKKCEKLEEQVLWYERFSEERYLALYHLGFLVKESWMSSSIRYLHKIAELLIHKISTQPDLELMRKDIEVSLSEEELANLIDDAPYVTGNEFVTQDWINQLWTSLFQIFQREVEHYEDSMMTYFAEYNSNIAVVGRVFFHLVETKDDVYPFAFMATYTMKPVKSKKAIHTPLQNALIEFKKDQTKLLNLMATVAKAADQSSLISNLMESGELFLPLHFTSEEAYTFLKEIPLYETAGIMCRVPDWWRKKSHTIKVSAKIGEKEKSKLGKDALLDFSPSLMIDGEKITKSQIQEFLKMSEGLVEYKGKWIEISHKKLQDALLALEKVKKMCQNGEISFAEAMRLELNAGRYFDENAEVEVQISNGAWYKNLREQLNNPQKIAPLKQESSVHATLRPYQAEGYRWLDMMAKMGFGACLADDMGLGKTIQVIAWLEHYRVNVGGHALIILPASLIGNWQREIEKFAPEMTYQILHKSAKNADLKIDETKFLAITTYNMVSRLEELTTYNWDICILDEAQAIKNAGTKQSKAVKSIHAKTRMALTGTPIENSLADLWSLFDFLNQGILGTAKEFAGFVKQVNEEDAGYGALRKIVNPFILRRLKSDRSIISDLPDKIEIQEYTSLSKKQTLLYQQLVDTIQEKLDTVEGIERKGLVLASIMKFKQICNHPDQYLGLEEFKPENSGKFQQLQQICETIYEKRERVLVFTQFKEMCEPLAEFLSKIFHKKGLVLHGGTPIKKRNEMVETFNGEAYVPFMVLSLKAGGVGLNLTSANHVVHFDRWWNPAVENQATDRAYRIGQTKNVMIHKFISEGTIEEKIDAMISDKQKLSKDILASGNEQWISEFNNEQLMNLFKLGGE